MQPLALVTGGCRRLGAAIAARLARDGWALALHGHSDAEPEPALKAVLDDEGTAWRGVTADLADEEATATLLDRAEQACGRPVTLLVNNAAPFADDDWRSMTRERLLSQFAVIAAAPALLTRDLAVRAERRDERANVVMILDQRIDHPHGDQASYTLAKLALAGAVRMLAAACAPTLRVNAVAPGLVLPTEDYGEAQLDRLAERMPTGALPRPQEVADAVAWLARADAVTAQVLYVDGGAHRKSFARDFVRMDRDSAEMTSL